MGDLAGTLSARRANDRRHPDAALGGVGFYEARRCSRRLRPARTVPGIGAGPPDIVEALHGFLARSLDDAKVAQGLDRLGMATRPMSRQEYRAYIAGEIQNWAGHVRAAGIQPE